MAVKTSNSIGAGSGGLAALLATLLSASCVDSNSRITLGRGFDQGVVLETFTAPEFPDPRAGPVRGDDRQSLVGLDRGNWSSRDFLVPVDGTRHRPNYATLRRYTDVTARQRNEYPTLLSSLHLDGTEAAESEATNEHWQEALIAPLHALGQMVIIPIKLLVEPQTMVEASPQESYQRRPTNPAKLTGPALHPEEELLRRPQAPADVPR